MNPSVFGTMLVRFLALELWLVALVWLVLQMIDWMRVRRATTESLDDKYFIASGSHWLLAALLRDYWVYWCMRGRRRSLDG